MVLPGGAAASNQNAFLHGMANQKAQDLEDAFDKLCKVNQELRIQNANLFSHTQQQAHQNFILLQENANLKQENANLTQAYYDWYSKFYEIAQSNESLKSTLQSMDEQIEEMKNKKKCIIQ